MQIVIDINEHLYKMIKTLGLVVEDGDAVVVSEAIKNGTSLPKGHGRIGDLSELETRIGNFIEHYKNLLEQTNPEALIYMNHILDGIIVCNYKHRGSIFPVNLFHKNQNIS